MPRLSVTLTDEQNQRVEELVESGEYSSKNAVVQDWLADAERVNQLESELAQTEARVEDLRRQLQQANAGERDVDELVAYVEDERELRRRREEREQRREERRQANVFRRAWWYLAGTPEDGETAP
jgi:Arc/MetJ-type ribon-helix-helix transcriptional regulator